MDLTAVYSDGATVGHNGLFGTVREVGIGVYIPDWSISIAKKLPGKSNNEAEFLALIEAMDICFESGLTRCRFHLDSQIVVNRANGARPKGKFANDRMDAFQDLVFEKKEQFAVAEFKWIPREQNEDADALSKAACSL